MSQKHINPLAWHDPDLWRWSAYRGCWVRCTDTVQPPDTWGSAAYGWSVVRRRWDTIGSVLAEGGYE